MISHIFHVSKLSIFVAHTHFTNQNFDTCLMLVSNYSRSDTKYKWNPKFTLQVKLMKKILRPWQCQEDTLQEAHPVKLLLEPE